MASDLCFCDSCGPQGAVQARATRSIHAKAQEARSRLSKVPVAVQSTAAYPQKVERAPRNPNENVISPSETPHVSHAFNDTEAHAGGRQVLSTETIQSRLTQFVRPQRLVFRYPPVTPTEMYPGCGDDETWKDGPAGLQCEDRTNASVLLHISFLLSMRDIVQTMQNDDIGPIRMRILAELAAMESWRMFEWVRQQRQAPDPQGLGQKQYNTGRYRQYV